MHDTDDSLVDAIYEAAAVPELWRGVLTRIARASQAPEAVMIASRGTRFLNWVTTSPAFDDLVEAYFRRFPDNIRTRRLLALRHAGFVTDHDVMNPDEIATEPLYRDFMVPRGYGVGVATAIFVPSGDSFIVHCERSETAGPFERRTIAMLDGLRPHLARAALLSARLANERAEAATRALEALGLPAAILGQNGRLIDANPLLTALIPDTLSDLPSRLAIADRAADTLFREALETARTAPEPAPVRSIPIAARNGRPPVILHLVPIRGAAHDVFARARFILVATPVVTRDVPSANVIQGLFDLTPSEAKVATMIAAGEQPAGAAVKLGLTTHTVRSTLKGVFRKTGVVRQAELVGLLRGTTVLDGT